MTRGGYWTGPVIYGRQYGWRCEWASGPFGVPQFHGYGMTEAEARADLERQIREDGATKGGSR